MAPKNKTNPADQGGQTNQDQNIEDFAFVQNLGFPKRAFKGFSPDVPLAEQEQIRLSLGLRSTPGALLRGPRLMEFPQYITTPVLYDDQGRVAGMQYNFEDPFLVQRELAKLGADDIIRISKELKRVGFYGDKKISEALMRGVGYSGDDERAWATLLDMSNKAQRRWTDMVGMLASFSTITSPGPVIRVTSDEDAAAYTREVFLSELGRMPTRKEMADAAAFIRNRERQAFATGQQMPNTGLVAQTFAQKADPTSRTVYGLGNAISLAMQALGQ